MSESAADLRAAARAAAAKVRELTEAAERVEAAERLERIRAREVRKPKQPDLSEGQVVVVFEKLLGGRSYTYAAIGWSDNGGRTSRWSITGNADGRNIRHNWAGLLEFVGESNWGTLSRVTKTKPLVDPALGQSPIAEEIGARGKVVGTFTNPFDAPNVSGEFVIGFDPTRDDGVGIGIVHHTGR